MNEREEDRAWNHRITQVYISWSSYEIDSGLKIVEKQANETNMPDFICLVVKD